MKSLTAVLHAVQDIKQLNLHGMCHQRMSHLRLKGCAEVLALSVQSVKLAGLVLLIGGSAAGSRRAAPSRRAAAVARFHGHSTAISERTGGLEDVMTIVWTIHAVKLRGRKLYVRRSVSAVGQRPRRRANGRRWSRTPQLLLPSRPWESSRRMYRSSPFAHHWMIQSYSGFWRLCVGET